ncbi:hypothetical protein H4219_004108 [Mycoemilia scoparia]|uniref:2-hydroxyacyl-CoA lyase n=1 Tax=Mycoemilia scoparia TaxID=417184 RepID=A0A9W7ZSS7_9FUNG|nr:hypothetical protein H4219_004108 [Mycoemilia scoparia]
MPVSMSTSANNHHDDIPVNGNTPTAEANITKTTGASVIARSLKLQGVTVVFGIVGIPVVEVAEACMEEGIQFVGFRNEQSASYAASAWGYLSGRPGVCLVVSGPGVVHALAGIVNAQVNNWPILVIGGSCESFLEGAGAFQELNQVELCRPYTKFSARPPTIKHIPSFIEKGFRSTATGRPGPAYLDFPANIIQGTVDEDLDVSKHTSFWKPSFYQADPHDIFNAARLISEAKRPLAIIGKGASYSRGENEIRKFIEQYKIPFLPTPMGKGVVPDSHPLCVAAARSMALAQSDVIILLGARVNWILHFGLRFDSEAKVIQVDVAGEEIGTNRHVDVPLIGHLPLVVQQLLSTPEAEATSPQVIEERDQFVKKLGAKIKTNIDKLAVKFTSQALPMTYHRAFAEIRSRLPEDNSTVVVSEGANTMDIARSVFDFDLPRQRLDAGTFATMGVGLGFAIAAQIYYGQSKRVIGIVGDSAFGFSALELETAARAKLPLIMIIINNNGIYHGLDENQYQALASDRKLPSTALLPDVRYEMIAEAVGGVGYLVRTPEDLAGAFEASLKETEKISVINCLIQPGGPQKLVSVNC